ncbi:phosphate-responsive family protein [Dorcoceras hygrometricum]|uniref:Phosphate-responsive family protein n=1 Tax=Dorcoceras hygrometricum TaxID=472368 RepID=A0A2Z7C613_9LAMI|nr:phosphate-responsive family protein [Dorcoceras hygrometricum]
MCCPVVYCAEEEKQKDSQTLASSFVLSLAVIPRGLYRVEEFGSFKLSGQVIQISAFSYVQVIRNISDVNPTKVASTKPSQSCTYSDSALLYLVSQVTYNGFSPLFPCYISCCRVLPPDSALLYSSPCRVPPPPKERHQRRVDTSDVTVAGFYVNRCGTDGSKSSVVKGKNQKFAYIWVGNSETQSELVELERM